VQNDTALQASAHARDANLQAQPLARASLLPQLGGSYTYGKSRDDIHLTGIDSNTGQPTVGEREVDSNSDTLSVSASQTIFDWGAFKRLSQASTQAALAQVQYRASEQDLVLRAAQAYFNVLAAADGLGFAQAENKAVERQLEQARKRFEVGLSAITDVQESQAAYDLTVASVLQAEQQLASSRQALTEITAVETTHLVLLQPDFPLPGPDPSDVQSWIAKAQENNLDLIASRLGTEIARKDVSIASAGHLPTVNLTASYADDNDESDTNGVDSTRDTKGRQIGVSLQVPIFSGFAVRSQVRQAESIHEQRKAEEEGARRSVERQIRDAYLGVISGASQVKALKQAVLSNTTALEASQTGFEVGTRTTVDVLNSQRDLFSAQRDYAAARYNYLLSILSLKAAAGALGEKDLAEIDRLLIAEG
jgi:outer membrane protein